MLNETKVRDALKTHRDLKDAAWQAANDSSAKLLALNTGREEDYKAACAARVDHDRAMVEIIWHNAIIGALRTVLEE